MHLADVDILDRLSDGDLVIDPIENLDVQIQPASVDVRLSNDFLKFNPQNVTSVNPVEDNPEQFMEEYTLDDDESFHVHPGDFVLASVEEWVEVPDDLVGYVDGRSTFGRMAIVVHATAGLLDPGWKGNVTLEISNLGPIPVELQPGMRIAQLTFTEMKHAADRPYGTERGSKYQNQDGVQSARTDHEIGEASVQSQLSSDAVEEGVGFN